MEESVFATAAELYRIPSEFGEPVTEAYLKNLKSLVVPVKMRMQIKWATSRSEAWASNRNLKRPKEPVPLKL